MLLQQVWLSLYRFSRKPYLLIRVTFRLSILNLSQIGQKIWKLQVKIHLYP